MTQWDTSNGYPQHIFSWRDKRNMSWCLLLGAKNYAVMYYRKSGITIYYFLHTNICCEYSLKATRQGTANDTHKMYFYWEIKKIPRVTFIYSSLIGTLKYWYFSFFSSLKVTQTCKLKSSYLKVKYPSNLHPESDQGLLFPSFSQPF